MNRQEKAELKLLKAQLAKAEIRAKHAEAQVGSVLILCDLLDHGEDSWQRAMAASIRDSLGL